MSIEAMRQAIRVLKQLIYLTDHDDEIYEAIGAMEAAIEQAEKQEPVAWMYDFLNPDNRDEVIRDWTTQDYAEIEREKGFNVRPLYTAPRQWVGLTDEEIKALYDKHATYQEYDAWESGWFEFAVAFETKLKEKNR